MLTAELSKLGLTNAELFLGLHSDHELGCLVTDLRKPVEAEGVLTWSTGTPTLTVQHIAAALETAWQMSIVSMSQEDQSHCKKLCSLCSLQPDALTPHRNITELSMPQHILETCRNAVATFLEQNLLMNQHCLISSFSRCQQTENTGSHQTSLKLIFIRGMHLMQP